MKKILITIVVILAIAFYACKHTPPEGTITGPPGSGGTGGGGTGGGAGGSSAVCFQSDILPIFQSNCAKSNCHDAASHNDGYVLDSYENLFKKDGKFNSGNIRPYSPENSKLYKVLFEIGDKKMPRPPNPDLTTAQKNLIARWINEGALNTTNCNTSCDSTQFKFAANIQPILQNHCTGCHSGSAPPYGIDLTTYNSIKPIATSGRLYGAVAHLPGYSPMPKGSGMLSACEIAQIRKWSQAGAPNN